MRQHPLDFGNATTYAETIDLPIIKNYAEKILRAAEFNGICEVEFKRDERDGYYKFLEVNPRTWKWHAISNEANTPFLILFYNWLRGKEIIPEDGFKEASFVHLLTDIPTRAKLLLRGEKYWCRVRRPVENAVWSASDPKPWLFEKIYLIYFIFYR
jgi:predicted ATP-grasp superfamily ATP-dependent carboligase